MWGQKIIINGVIVMKTLVHPVVRINGCRKIKRCPIYDEPFRVDNYPNNCRVSNHLDKSVQERSCPYNTFQVVHEKDIEKHLSYKPKEEIVEYQKCKFPMEFFQESLF